MPLYVGSLCFLSIRSKTNTRSVGFLEYHIYHRPVRPVKTDSANVEYIKHRQSCSLRVILMHMSSMLGQIFLFFNVTPWQQTASLLISENRKNPHLLQPQDVPRDTFRRCETIQRDRRFRFLGHIPHILVDDGALLPFCPPRPRYSQRSLKTKRQTVLPTLQPITLFRAEFQTH